MKRCKVVSRQAYYKITKSGSKRYCKRAANAIGRQFASKLLIVKGINLNDLTKFLKKYLNSICQGKKTRVEGHTEDVKTVEMRRVGQRRLAKEKGKEGR